MIKTVNKIITLIGMVLLLTVAFLPVCTQVAAQSNIEPERAAQFINKLKITGNKKWFNYQCYTSVDKDTYCIRKKDFNDQGQLKRSASVYTRSSKATVRRGCDVVSVAWSNNRDCPFCGMLAVTYKASDYLASHSLQTFAKSFQALIVIVFVIWLGIKTLNHVSFLTSQDTAKYITDILLQAFKFLLAYFALSYSVDADGTIHWYLFDKIIKPIFESGLEFAAQFVNSGLENDTLNKIIEGTKDETGKFYVVKPIDLSQVENNKLYDASMYKKLEAFAQLINMQFSLLQTLGRVLRCLGGKYLTLFNVFDVGIQFGLGLNCLIYGLLIGLIGFLLILAFVFYLFDAVVELGIFGAVLPFAIACWPFKLFTKTAGNAIKLFMNSTFTFMMAGVAVCVCLQLIFHALGTTNAGGNAGISELVQALDTLDVPVMKKHLSVISIEFLLFAFAGFSGFLLVGKIASLTNTFAGGGLSPTASNVATTGASAVAGATKKVAKPTTDAIGKKFEAKTREVVNRVANSRIGQFAGKTAEVAGTTAVSAAIAGPAGLVVVGAVEGNKVIKSVQRKRAKTKGI